MNKYITIGIILSGYLRVSYSVCDDGVGKDTITNGSGFIASPDFSNGSSKICTWEFRIHDDHKFLFLNVTHLNLYDEKNDTRVCGVEKFNILEEKLANDDQTCLETRPFCRVYYTLESCNGAKHFSEKYSCNRSRKAPVHIEYFAEKRLSTSDSLLFRGFRMTYEFRSCKKDAELVTVTPPNLITTRTRTTSHRSIHTVGPGVTTRTKSQTGAQTSSTPAKESNFPGKVSTTTEDITTTTRRGTTETDVQSCCSNILSIIIPVCCVVLLLLILLVVVLLLRKRRQKAQEASGTNGNHHVSEAVYSPAYGQVTVDNTNDIYQSIDDPPNYRGRINQSQIETENSNFQNGQSDAGNSPEEIVLYATIHKENIEDGYKNGDAGQESGEIIENTLYGDHIR